MTKVFVSGANGFIGAQVTKHLIAKGYDVVGSVRTAAKGEKLKNLLGAKFSYEIVLALTNEGAFEEALEKHPDVTVFLHTASPVVQLSENPELEVLKPAIWGTLSALRAAQRSGPNIKKFILTSSMAAVGSSRMQGVVDETKWSDVTYEEAITKSEWAYSGSKKFGELSAWEFIEREKPGFTLTVVNPVYVFGPVAFVEGPESFSSTLRFILQILQTKEGEPMFPISGSGVDVRDVADLHIAAFENDNLAGKRLIASNGFWNAQLVLDIARKYFPELSKTLPEGTPGSSAELNNRERRIDNSETTRLSGIKWRPLETSFKDSIAQAAKVLGDLK